MFVVEEKNEVAENVSTHVNSEMRSDTVKIFHVCT